MTDPGTLFWQYLTIGLVNGALFALIALGYTMVYGIIELINFAHGDLFMLGSFLALQIAICLSFVFMNAGVFWMGPYTINFPDLVSSRNLTESIGLRFTYKDVMVIGVTIPTMIALTLFVRYTTLGKAMRAT